MTDQTPLSVCIPTKDDAETIEKCLETAKPVADEIVVLDGGSTDETVDICRDHGCEIYHEEQFTGFADLYTELVEHASHEWVLLVDSDEWLSPSVQQEAEAALDSGEHIGYDVAKRNYMYGQWMNIGHKYRPQLAKKQHLSFEEGYIHEEWVVDTTQGTVGRLSWPINHRAYDTVSEHLQTIDRYTSLEALKAVENDPWYKRSLPFYLIRGILAFGFFFGKERGYKDGYRGLLFSTLAFYYRLVTHAKVQDLQRERRQNRQSWRDDWLREQC